MSSPTTRQGWRSSTTSGLWGADRHGRLRDRLFVAELFAVFPFDKIKIDQSFVRGLGSSKGCAALVKAVVDLRVSLGITTTAKGIETKDRLNRARVGDADRPSYQWRGKELRLRGVTSRLLTNCHSSDLCGVF
ncbi:EAL domain-containing protein [Rhizobium leguminosarum]|uniref:EAL domain-containing protein n=1 Tax=Rhizobium leguminosarum TaxID=384 RepID=UPI0035A1D104